jgi:flagellar motility protein MotE (MotC chaperone)
MKPRDVYKRLALDPKTLITWVDRLPKFFSEGARGVLPGALTRDYSEDDLIVINTILKMRAEKKEFKQIEESLSAGYRDRELPPTFYEMDAEKAVTVYADMREMKVNLEVAQAEIERLRAALEKQAQESERLRSEERERLQGEIRRLEREIGRLQGKYERDDK